MTTNSIANYMIQTGIELNLVAMSLPIGTSVSVSFLSNSGKRNSVQGEKKTLKGFVVKFATLAKATKQYVVTLETEKGFRSFPCQTVTNMEIYN